MGYYMCKSFKHLILLYICFCSTTSYAKTLNVDIKNTACNEQYGQPFCHINSAIKFSSPDDIIHVASGTYIETLIIDKNIKIIGSDRQNTVIDGARKSSVIEILPGVRSQLKSLRIQNGYATNGGGILNYGSLLLDDIQISYNFAQFSGGGIFNASSIIGSLYIKNTVIEHNQALGNDKQNIKYGGGGIYNSSPLILENSKLQFNRAVDNGGGLYTIHTGRKKSSEGEIIAEKLGINSASKRIRSLRRIKDLGSVYIKNSLIHQNYAEAGGGINVHGVLNITASIISQNQATNGFRSAGGGLFAHFDTTLSMSNVIVNFNKATFRGGGIRFYSVASGKFFNVSIIDNEVIKDFGQGAGLFVIKGENNLEIQNSLIARNYINSELVDDCYGAFKSIGHNYLSSIQNCSSFNPTIDLHQPLTGVDHLYQWDESQSQYKTLSSSLLNDAGQSTGCKNEKDKLLTTDVYGNQRHVDSDANGVPQCDIGAIEYIPNT